MPERETARLISAVERGEGAALLAATDSPAQVVGITGPPGSGKSTLVDALAARVRQHGLTVAILAIDPSSHTTGGAVLGDRVRMSSLSRDEGVYIRSMGTRGVSTGLARAARDAVRVLESAGYDLVIVETVGVGQVELDVLTVADTVVLVMVPGLGDTMQMNKAGIMEIGDVFTVNMADRPETGKFVRELKQALSIGATSHADLPPVCRTTATTGEGVPELWEAIQAHGERDVASGERVRRRRRQSTQEFREEVERLVVARLHDLLDESAEAARLHEEAADGQVLPGVAARRYADQITLGEG